LLRAITRNCEEQRYNENERNRNLTHVSRL
jgi:hypothetical protein